MTLGKGLTYAASFDARHQMIDMIVSRPGLDVLDLSYNHDANGRVASITDHVVADQDRPLSACLRPRD